MAAVLKIAIVDSYCPLVLFLTRNEQEGYESQSLG